MNHFLLTIPKHEAPAPLQGVPGLLQIPRDDYGPGVYFLCDKDEVVYVGQSINPQHRIAVHASDPRKQFDRIYLLHVDRPELDNVESALIHHLEPRFNGRYGHAKTWAAPKMTRPQGDVLREIFQR